MPPGSGMLRFVTTLALLAFNPALAASETPLFDYARELPFESVLTDSTLSQQLAQAEHQIERNPPPKEDCARTLGANRFAAMYDSLGSVQSALGDTDAAIESFRKSLECNPRKAPIRASLASALMHVGQLTEARAELERGLAIDPVDLACLSTLMQLDFIEERWSDVISRVREDMTRLDIERATYWQCFRWLAQRRSGVRVPEGIDSELTDDWPRPVLDALRGEITEAELLDELKDENNDRRQREMLSEALFYIGQARLADGDVGNARLYLTATVNLKVMYFIEHHLALAELAKIRERGP